MVVAGSSNTGAGGDVIVRAHSVIDGRDLWDERVDPHGEHDSVASLAIAGKTVAIVGLSQPTATDADYFLQTFDLATGTPGWSDRVDEAGSDLFDWGTCVIGKGKRLIGAGNVRTDPATRAGLIKVYSIK